MRILVCGRYTFHNLYSHLDLLHIEVGIDFVVGADKWAHARKVPWHDVIPIKQFQDRYGDNAVAIRNKFMLDMFEPDLVLIFHPTTWIDDNIRCVAAIRGTQVVEIEEDENQQTEAVSRVMIRDQDTRLKERSINA